MNESDSLRKRYAMMYAGKVESFATEVDEGDGIGICEPHLPIWGRNYHKAKVKVALIGIETNYWGDMAVFIKVAKLKPETAIFRGEKLQFREDIPGEAATFDELGFLERNDASFWGTAVRVLALFHNVDWHDLKERRHDEILRSFVWAETNSVESWKTTERYNKATKEAWERVKAASKRHFDSYATMADTFRPHVVVVMDTNSDPYWDPGRPEFKKIGDHVWYGHDQLIDAHIFNTAHPTYLACKPHLRNQTFETVSKKWQELSGAH